MYCLIISAYFFLHLVFTIYFVGVVDYLTTEISTSKQKKFSLVTFVDTPGLVDGDMKYAFDVDESILWLGQLICENLHGFSDFHHWLTEVLSFLVSSLF